VFAVAAVATLAGRRKKEKKTNTTIKNGQKGKRSSVDTATFSFPFFLL
jgi:hypothetical protein